MDTNVMKRLKARAESNSFLIDPLIYPKFSRSKIINDKIRIKKPEKIESFLSNPESKSQIFKYFLQELEVRLGFKVPNDSIDHAAKFIKDKLTYKIECSLAELHEFSKKIEKIILDYESFNCSSWNLGIAGEEFIFLINSNDSCVSKDELTRFMSFSQEETSKLNGEKEKVYEFNKSVQDFCMDLEGIMESQYENLKKAKFNEDILKINKNSRYLIQYEIEDNKKRRLECSQLKNDLEWQKEELRFIIAQTKYKKNECVSKEVLLENQISRIRTRRVSMAQELENIEIENNKLENQKEKIQNVLNYLISIINSIQKKPASTPPDPSTLQSQIKDLEAQLKLLEKNLSLSSIQEQDSISTQIYRLKTKISSLKSINVINKNLKSTSSAKNLMQSLNKMYKISKPYKSSKDLKKSPFSLFISSNLYKKESNFNYSSNISTLKTDRSLSVGFSNLYEKNDEDFYRLESLRKQESIFEEKEEIIETSFDWILNEIQKFDKVLGIEGFKAEIRKIKERLVNKERLVDEELKNVARMKTCIAEREKGLERLNEEVGEGKWRVLGVLEDAVENLERFVEDFN